MLASPLQHVFADRLPQRGSEFGAKPGARKYPTREGIRSEGCCPDSAVTQSLSVHALPPLVLSEPPSQVSILQQPAFCVVRSLIAFRLTSTHKDYCVVGTDAGKVTILEFLPDTAEVRSKSILLAVVVAPSRPIALLSFFQSVPRPALRSLSFPPQRGLHVP